MPQRQYKHLKQNTILSPHVIGPVEFDGAYDTNQAEQVLNLSSPKAAALQAKNSPCNPFSALGFHDFVYEVRYILLAVSVLCGIGNVIRFDQD